MKRLFSLPKTFLRTFAKTISDPVYYNHVIQARFSFSLKYFLGFYLILAVLNTTIFTTTQLPQIEASSRDLIHQLTTSFPQNLEITIDSGELSVTGQPTPIQVPFPQSFSQIRQELDSEYLVVIDPQTQTAAPNAFITLTQTEIIIRQPDGSKQSYPYDTGDTPITLNQQTLGLVTSAAQTYIDLAVKYLPFLVFLFLASVAPLFSLLYLSLLSLPVLILTRSLNKPLTYKKSLQLGLHTYTFAETARFLQRLIAPQVDISFFFPIAFFGATLIALWALKPPKFVIIAKPKQ